MDWCKEPNLKQFAEVFQQYLADIGCMDNVHGWIGSHKIVGRIRVIVENDEDMELDITGLETEQLMGCGCASDISIRVRRVMPVSEPKQLIGYVERPEGFYNLYSAQPDSAEAIRCKYCESEIHHCGGPKYDAVCLVCYQLDPDAR